MNHRVFLASRFIPLIFQNLIRLWKVYDKQGRKFNLVSRESEKEHRLHDEFFQFSSRVLSGPFFPFSTRAQTRQNRAEDFIKWMEKKSRQCFKHRHNIIVYKCALYCAKRWIGLSGKGFLYTMIEWLLLAAAKSFSPPRLGLCHPSPRRVALSVDIQYYNAIMIALYISRIS